MNNAIADLISQLQHAISAEAAKFAESLRETKGALLSLAESLPAGAPSEGSTQSDTTSPQVETPKVEPATAVAKTTGPRPKRYLQIHTILEIARILDTGFGPAEVAERARTMGIENFSLRHLGQTMAHMAAKKKNPALQIISPGRGRRAAVYRFLPPA